MKDLAPAEVNLPEKSDTESLPGQMDQHNFNSSDEELAPKKRIHSEADTTISNPDGLIYRSAFDSNLKFITPNCFSHPDVDLRLLFRMND